MAILTIGFPGDSDGKESACNAGDLGLIPASGRSPREGNGNPLQYFCLENFMDWGAGGLQSMGSHWVGHDWATNTIHVYATVKWNIYNLKKNLFWLPWLFIAACGLSLVVASWGYSSSGAWASHCGGFCCHRAGALKRTGFSSCALGSVVPACRL